MSPTAWAENFGSDDSLSLYRIRRPYKIIQEDVQLASADKIPWRQFLQAFSKLSISVSHHSPNQIAYTAKNGISAPSAFEETLDFLFSSKYLKEDVFDYVHPAFHDPTPYMPPRKDGCVDIHLKSRHSLSRRESQFELLKHVVFLLSNNLNTTEVADTVVEFARERHNRDLLERFFISGLTTTEAVAETLIFPAALGRNYPLVEILLDSGADINIEDRRGDGTNQPLLWHATEACDEELVRSLLKRSTYLWKSLHFRSESADHPTLLSFAVKHANVNILDLLTTHLQTHAVEIDIDCWEFSFTNAALRGDVEILKLLVSIQTPIFESLKKIPWILYEAAALGGSIPMVKTLQTMGFDIRAKSPLNQGNSLVCALLNDCTEVAHYLLDAGSSIDNYPSTTKNSCCFQDRDAVRSIRMQDAQKFAPIHAAVCTRNVPILRRLIVKGADPNQVGIRFPVQIAAWVGSVEIARLLLEAGARVDFVSLRTYFDYDHFFCRPARLEGGYCKYHSMTTEQSAVQIALQRGDEKMFELLVQAGARLPTTASCLCMRLKDTRFNQHTMPEILCLDKAMSTWTCSCGKEEIHGHPCLREIDMEENIWNPLLNAAIGRNRKLFARVLEIAKAENMPWITTKCLVRCIRSFGSVFAKSVITCSTLSGPGIVYSQLLIQAVEENEEDLVDEIIQIHDGVSSVEAGEAYVEAVWHGRENLVRKFHDFGFWPDDTLYIASKLSDRYKSIGEWEFHLSPLRAAFEKGQESVLRLMFDYYNKLICRAREPGIREHFLQAYGIAIRFGNMPMIKLLAVTESINTVLYTGVQRLGSVQREICHVSAVQLGAQFRQYDVVFWLLDQGASPELFERDMGDNALVHSPLQCASAYGMTSVVERLLEKGANPNTQPATYNGATALQFAAMTGRFDLVNRLLSAGANLHAPPGLFEGRSAIEGAAEVGLLDMVSYLLEMGAGEDMKGAANSNYRRTVYRAWKHGHHAVARMLNKWKAKVDGSYSNHQDSIEAILETMTPEILLCSVSYRLEPGWDHSRLYCQVCLPLIW